MSEGRAQAAPPLLVEGLNASYNGALALRDVSFAVEAPQRVAVVGPNGAGKTTLFKVVAGLLRPLSGRLTVHGHEPGRHTCVAYVPQHREVDLRFPASVRDVVMMGRVREIGMFRRPGSRDRERVEEALEQVGMLGLRDAPIGSLSGGQQQRAFLAQAVAQEAQLALLDEPLTGLDAPSQDAILEILERLKDQGVTTLVATHDLQLSRERFDRALLLNRRVVAFGPPREVFTHPTILEAYGEHLHLIADEGLVTMLDDPHHPPGEP